jgi:ATP-binding cassette subfamily B protein
MIREALSLLMRGRTVIAIAHRLSTVRGFDRIIMLHEGKVVEDGPPDHLVKHGGPYSQIVRRELNRLASSAA